MRRSILSRMLGGMFRGLNRIVPWHRLPTKLAVLNLWLLRERLRERNLHDTSKLGASSPQTPAFEPPCVHSRIPGGAYNDLNEPCMGMAGSRFGRNVPLSHADPEPEPQLLQPSPREISRRLMRRESFQPASTLNLLAAAWIQFQVHGWFNHGIDRERNWKIPLAEDDDWPHRPMEVHATAADPTRNDAGKDGPPTFINEESQWWDASAIYGSDQETNDRVRSHTDGKLKVEEGRLPIDPESGIAITGFSNNWWLGLSLLHKLFTLEHNAICDRLRARYPDWSDDQVYGVAKLVNTALMAKIHTVEWTPAILGHPALRIGMDANWWGLAGERITRIFGRLTDGEAISGILGSTTDHHGSPYALTEEFVSVYRMHPLIRDEMAFHNCQTGEHLRDATLPEISDRRSREVLQDNVDVTDAFYSFGITHPGAITLHNYPNFLRDLHTQDGRHIDLAAVDILRDRERGVPRYNDFRRLIHCPPARSFEALTSNRDWAEQLRQVYDNDIERVDLMVGMFAEDKPKGFGFSDTAFRIFILMASRRLKSDRFFTSDYTPQVYTRVGMNWLHDNDMTSVLLRHYPELAPALHRVDNAFAPWRRIEDLPGQPEPPQTASAG